MSPIASMSSRRDCLKWLWAYHDLKRGSPEPTEVRWPSAKCLPWAPYFLLLPKSKLWFQEGNSIIFIDKMHWEKQVIKVHQKCICVDRFRRCQNFPVLCHDEPNAPYALSQCDTSRSLNIKSPTKWEWIQIVSFKTRQSTNHLDGYHIHSFRWETLTFSRFL